MKKLQEAFTKEELEEFGMYQLGRAEGIAEGHVESIATLLSALLRRTFGDPPEWVPERLREIATVEEGTEPLLRIEDASSLKDIWG